MSDKNKRIVYWEFLHYDGIQKLHEHQRVIGTQILQMENQKGEIEHEVIIIIEEIVDDNYVSYEDKKEVMK